MTGFTGTFLQLQSMITAHILNSFWTTSVWRTSMKTFSLPWMHKWTPSYNCQAALICHHVQQLIVLCYSVFVMGILCLATYYLATTRSLQFVVAGTWFPSCCSAMDVRSGSAIPDFRQCLPVLSNGLFRHYTICGPYDRWDLENKFDLFTGQLIIIRYWNLGPVLI
jgi:hypothetical protein